MGNIERQCMSSTGSMGLVTGWDKEVALAASAGDGVDK